MIATKCGANMDRDAKPNTHGLSRKLIFDEVEKSLKRLGTDYIDLYIIHHPDMDTPVEETMEALDDLIRMGKIRYIGASNMKAWQCAKYQYTAKMHGWHTFISLQNTHNIFEREDERELFPMLKDMDVSLTAYKVLAGGRLSRDEKEVTERSLTQKMSERDEKMNAVIQKVADSHGCSKADILVAWELREKPVDCVLLGTTKPGRISDSARGLEVRLTEEELMALDEASKQL